MNARSTRNRKCEEDVAGIDINDGRITVAHFARKSDGRIELDRLATVDCPAQATDRQTESRIRTLWRQEKIPARMVRTCLHDRTLVVRYFQYNNLNQDELAQALALEAEEALQLPAAQICMDWHLNPIKYNASGNPEHLSGSLIAAPRKTVKHHLDLLKAAGLYAINVEVSCSAVCNLYTRLLGNTPPQPVCLVNLAERTADIIMYTRQGVYPRTLFSTENTWQANTAYLMENIQNALLYYHLRVRDNPVSKIILSGQVPAPDDFPGELSRQTSLPVEQLSLFDHPGLPLRISNLPESGSSNFVTAIGLALRGSDYDSL